MLSHQVPPGLSALGRFTVGYLVPINFIPNFTVKKRGVLHGEVDDNKHKLLTTDTSHGVAMV